MLYVCHLQNDILKMASNEASDIMTPKTDIERRLDAIE
jgi:CBS domain containing-hemolysin-like protein